MSCRQIQKMLVPYQDGELGAAEQSRISNHLQDCIVCRQYYAEMEKAWQSLEGIQEIETSPSFYGHICKKINNPPKHYFWRHFQWVIPLFPRPAVTFALLLIGVLSGAFLGNVIVKEWSEKNQVIYSQAPIDIHSINSFALAPPGTLGNGYLRMVRFSEDLKK